MQKQIIPTIVLLFATACSTIAVKGTAKMENEYLDFFHDTLPNYYSLVEQSLSERELSTGFYAKLKRQLTENGHIDARSVQTLKAAAKHHQRLRDQLILIAKYHKDWLDDDSIPAGIRIKGIMLSLSAALTAFDNYLFAVHQFQRHRHLRRIANGGDSAFFLESKQLLRAGLEYYSLGNYLSMKKAIKFYQRHAPELKQRNDELIFIDSLIQQSPHYHLIQKQSIFGLFIEKIRLYTQMTSDAFDWMGDESVHGVSQLFGNLAGLVATRKGLLFDNPVQHSIILENLQPGDILLEKTPFRLTDSLIPGYWGHAAIWIGSEAELIALGIWNDDRIRPHQAAIREGQRIVEAVRSGVRLSSLAGFLNIDDLAVLRKNALTDAQRRRVIFNAIAQLGKAYDFNFDVETSERIVCSELVYMAYTQTLWPTEKTLGRYAISPNHIAEKTVGGNFSLVQLYYQGKRVQKPESLWQQMLADNVKR